MKKSKPKITSKKTVGETKKQSLAPLKNSRKKLAKTDEKLQKDKTIPEKKKTRKRKLVKIQISKQDRIRKLLRSITLFKPEQNPIIAPNPKNYWEAWQTFNPGVILLDDKIHFLYRAIGLDGISRLGYAVSSNGFEIDERLPYPVYEHKTKQQVFNIHSYASGGSFGGAEDPRLVRVAEEDLIYMTYTACDEGLRVALSSIQVNDFLNQNWKWKSPVSISPEGEIHKNWLIFPKKINGKYAILHSIKPNIQIEYFDSLEFDDANIYIESSYDDSKKGVGWEKWIRGAAAPPIKTDDGWLLFYHAMDDDSSKYKVGAMLLDLNDPTQILYRAQEPVLQPEETYENIGFKPGVVYVCGAVVKDGLLLVYYGGADSYTCVAYAPLKEFLKSLKKKTQPVLRKDFLKSKK